MAQAHWRTPDRWRSNGRQPDGQHQAGRLPDGQQQVGQQPVWALGAAWRRRSALLFGTALKAGTALLLASPGWAQPAVNAHPTGGVVTAGSATIGSAANTTTITQSTQRAAVNWQSFDVGSQQTVDFVQPSSSAVTLNRVIGPDPSQIAGHIDANGQVILINQSGVMFYQGAQVNTAGLIVSAAGMSNANFMAGKLVLDQPGNPNASVVNQGSLTVTQAGLAAMVAPQVANSGVITAKLGHVVLAGAKTATVDLYGDGLLSLDVTNAVTQAPIGADGKPVAALVTNTGVIRADGGTVQLTAREADGLVQNLVQSGGTVAADSVGVKTGTVVLGGLGGSIVLTGDVSAASRSAAAPGGQVQVDASQGVTLAAGSRINASGAAGGGTVAIGTTLARAKGGPGTPAALTAKTVQVAGGAHIAANATRKGNGGHVTILSSQSTNVAGTIAATGGPRGGNGGFVEASGEQGFSLTGAVDVSAPHGFLGTILLDPANLTIIAGSNGSGDQDGNLTSTGSILAAGADTPLDQVSNGAIESLTGNIVLQAVNNLTVSAPINLTLSGQALTLQAGNNLVVQAGGPITTKGNISLSAADSTISGSNSGGGLTLDGTVRTTAGTVNLSAGTSGITLDGDVGGPTVNLNSNGGISQTGGTLSAGTLAGTSTGDVTLTEQNKVADLASFPLISASFSLTDSGVGPGLTISGPVSAVDVTITGAPSITTTGSIQADGKLTMSSGAGGIALNNGAVLNGPTISLETPAGIALKGITLTANATVGNAQSTVILGGGTVSEATTSTIKADLLESNATAPTGGVSLLGTQNAIAQLGSFVVDGLAQSFQMVDSVPLTVPGPVTLTDAASQNVVLQAAGSITETGLMTASGDITLAAGGAGPISPGPTPQPNSLVAVVGGEVVSTGGSVNLLVGPGGTVGLGFAHVGQPEFPATVAAASGDRVTIQTDALLVGKVSTVAALGGTIEIAPATQGDGINFAAPAAGILTLPQTALAKMHAGTLRLGAVTIDGTETTTAGAITVNIALDMTPIATTLDLRSTGAVTQNSGDTLTVGTLTGAAGSASLTEANLIGRLGGFITSGGFALTDNQALDVTGTVKDTGTGQTLALTTSIGDLTLSGSFTAPSDTLTLTSAGAISQSGGSIDVGTLTGSATTSASLTQPNLVGTLGAFSTNTGFALTNNQALAVTGPLTDTGAGQTVALTTLIGGITLGGTILAPGDTLALNAKGAISQPGGSLNVGTLTGTAGSATLNQLNLVFTLGAFTTSGGFALTNDETMTVLGPVTDTGSGQTVALTTTDGDITLNGAIRAPADTLNLTSAAAISQPGGSIDVTTLTGSAVESASLPQPTNLVGTLGAFSTTTGFTLVDNEALAMTGPVTDTGSGQTVALTTLIGGMTLDGAINAPADTLTLNSQGAISQSGGSIDVTTLTGSAASASLTQPNLIGILGAFTTSGGFALTDNQALDMLGQLTDTGTGQTVALTTLIGDITLNGVISAPSDTLHLVSAGAINQFEGSIDVATLTGSAVTSASLLLPANLVGTLGPFGTGAGFALIDNEALAVTGPVTDSGTGQTVALTTLIGGITLSGPISAPSDTLTLTSAGAISQPGGSIDVGTLTGSATTSASLTQPNLVGTLGAFSTSAGFALTNDQALVVTGPLTDTGTGQTVALTTLIGGMTLNGAINAAADTLALNAKGAISQPGGSIHVATLTGTAGSASLNQPNLVGSLGAFTTSGGFALTDNEALPVTGPVTDSGTGQTVALTTLIGGITLNGSISAASDTLTLTSAGATSQPGGSIDVATLTGSATTSANLLQPANLVGTLGAFSTTTGFALVDNETLGVTGPVTDTGTGQTVALTTLIGGMTFSGAVDAPADTLSLNSRGAISQPGGSIYVATLTGTASSASLTQPNLIGTLGAFTTSGGFALTNNQALGVTGPLTDTGTGQTVALSTLIGGITLNGAISAPSDTLNLVSAGAVTQPGGSIDVAALTGNVGSALLTRTNLVGALGAFITNGDFALTDNEALTVSGPLTGTSGGSIALSTLIGGLTLNGVINAPSDTLQLVSDGPISQLGGSLDVGSLNVSTTAAGNVILTSATNLIGGSTGISVSNGNLELVDASSLVLSGNESANNLFVEMTAPGGLLSVGESVGPKVLAAHLTAAPGGRITLVADNTAAVTGSTVTAAGGVVELAPYRAINASLVGSTGMTIGAPLLSGITTDTLIVGGYTNVLAGAAGPATSAASISVDGAVDLTGHATTLLLLANGPVSEAGGPLTVNTLAANAGVIVLDNPANAVSVLADVTGTGFALDDSTNLLVSTVLNANNIMLRAPGSQISLADGATVLTGGTIPARGPIVPALEPVNGAPGAYIQAANFDQIGTSTLAGQDGGPATLQISTTQHAQFDPPLGLQASDGWLILNLGNGTAAGNVNVRALNVTYGKGGSADLTGTIDGITGRIAAAQGFIQPSVNSRYLFNDCAIGAVACLNGTLPQQQNETSVLGTLSPWLLGTVPAPLIGLMPLVVLANPLPPAPAGALTDPDVVPPNVSYVDY